jgi:hypothetical protein
MALYDPRLTALFGGRPAAYSQEEQMQVARELGLIGQEWVFDENTGQGRMMDGQIKDPQAVIREIQRRDYEQYVPQDLRAALVSQPTAFLAGDRYVDQAGNALSRFGLNTEDGGWQRFLLPTSVADKYKSQLNAQDATFEKDESSWFDKLGDRVVPAGAMAMATMGAMSGLEGLYGGSEMFNADLLDASLIGEYAGAAPGSGSFFAPASQATAGMFGPGAAEALDASLIGPNAGAAAGSGSVFAPSLSIPSAAQGASTGKTVLDSVKQAGKELGTYAPLLGALAGGAAGAVGSGGKAGTITVEEGIPDWLMPYLKPTLDRYSTDIQNYNVDPYGVMPAAMEQFKNTISGQYLDPSTNKWLEDYYRLGAERVKGTLSPSFGHMQAFGSHSGYNEALSRGLSDMAVGLYGGAYEKERDRQNSMIAAAPNFLTQSSLSAFAPYQQYLSTVGGLGKKKDQPYYEPSNFQNILGGAMAGYGLGKVFA